MWSLPTNRRTVTKCTATLTDTTVKWTLIRQRHDSSISIVTRLRAERQRNRGLIPAKSKNIFSSSHLVVSLRCPISRSSSATIQQQRCEPDHWSGKLNVCISTCINPLNAESNPICYLLALLGAHHFLQVSRIRVNMESGFVQYRVPLMVPNSCMTHYREKFQ